MTETIYGSDGLKGAVNSDQSITPHILAGGFAAFPAATLALRANATAYTSGKIIAQSTTANLCSPLSLAVGRVINGTGLISRLRLKINSATWLNAIIRVHLFKDAPTFTNGDAANFAAGLSESAYLGYSDITLDQSFSDPFVKGIGSPAAGNVFAFDCATGTQNISAVLEGRSSVTADALSKTFTLIAETLNN